MARKLRQTRVVGTLSYGGKGKVICHVYRNNGPMRKHGTWLHEQMDAELRMLDLISHVRARPMGAHGLVVRRKAV